MRNTPPLRELDCKLYLMLDDTKDARLIPLRNAIVKHLRARGFRMGLDPQVKKNYSSIAKNHHRGQLNNLEVKINLCGRSLEVEFFQNVVRENSNGGEYDFNRRAKMPYLIGKQYELERNKLREIYSAFGLTLHIEQHLRGLVWIQQRQEELRDFQGRDFYDRPRPDYNTKSRAGKIVKDGDVVYFRDRCTGYTVRGIAHANINSMWWVLLPCGTVRNVSAWELSHREDFDADMSGRCVPADTVKSQLRRKKERAVKQEQFEFAARLRDALARQEAA